jgi:hypothetical protein
MFKHLNSSWEEQPLVLFWMVLNNSHKSNWRCQPHAAQQASWVLSVPGFKSQHLEKGPEILKFSELQFSHLESGSENKCPYIKILSTKLNERIRVKN